MTYSEISINLNSLKFATVGGYTAGFRQSRIEALGQMRDKILAREKITKTPTMFPYRFFLLFIDTELEKLEKK